MSPLTGHAVWHGEGAWMCRGSAARQVPVLIDSVVAKVQVERGGKGAAVRRDLASEEERVAAARERSRRADERSRLAEAQRLEARLGLEQVRDWLLVELA